MASAVPVPALWLLLVHQLPAKPAYLRVKVWRRLQGLGAVTVKNSVYVLPAGEQAQEDLEWLLREIVDGGGEGLIWEARLINGLCDDEVRGLFNAARSQDYRTLVLEARDLAASLDHAAGPPKDGDTRTKLARLRTNLERIGAVDFFGADGRETAEGFLSGLDEKLREDDAVQRPDEIEPSVPDECFQGRTWVTRHGVQVDRMASAWLIRRFIDHGAHFKFVSAKGYTPLEGELRFDMFDGEFSHQGDRCTFEVLTDLAGSNDAALTAMGEIVHDIDLKDSKFGRDEASGIARVLESIAAANREDKTRIERAAAVFDDLYELFHSQEL